MSLFVAVLSGLYFTVSTSVDPLYRERFFDPLDRRRRGRLAERDAYPELSDGETGDVNTTRPQVVPAITSAAPATPATVIGSPATATPMRAAHSGSVPTSRLTRAGLEVPSARNCTQERKHRAGQCQIPDQRPNQPGP